MSGTYGFTPWLAFLNSKNKEVKTHLPVECEEIGPPVWARWLRLLSPLCSSLRLICLKNHPVKSWWSRLHGGCVDNSGVCIRKLFWAEEGTWATDLISKHLINTTLQTEGESVSDSQFPLPQASSPLAVGRTPSALRLQPDPAHKQELTWPFCITSRDRKDSPAKMPVTQSMALRTQEAVLHLCAAGTVLPRGRERSVNDDCPPDLPCSSWETLPGKY